MQMFYTHLIVIFGVVKCVEKTKVIEIGRPLLTCDETGNIKEVPSELTYIKLPPDKNAFYSLNAERTFENTAKQYNAITWKTLRSIEMFLNRHFANTKDDGKIYIKSDLFVPGFHYLLHVTLRKSPGNIEERDYNLTFFSSILDSSQEIVCTLQLITGNNYFYTFFPVIVNANITLCGKQVYYNVKWEISTSNKTIKFDNKNDNLSFHLQDVFRNNETVFTVNCQVLENENNSIIAKESVDIFINYESGTDNILQVFLPYKYITVNIGESLFIKPHIYSPQSTEYRIKWECMLDDILLYGCQGQLNEEFYMETGFLQAGNYTIFLTVKVNNIEKTVLTNILVQPGVPSITFDVSYPVVPERGIEISADISALRTYCTVQWLDVESNEMKLSDIPGISNEPVNIISKDKYFLEELIDFGNTQVTRHFKLKIPSISKTWNGLKDDSVYKIKIVSICPDLEEVNREDVIESDYKPENTLTSSGEVEIYVPPLPKIGSFNVYPHDGQAFSTSFSYKVIKYPENSKPLLYQYGYEFEGVDVIFFEGIDVFSGQTILPCSQESGVSTFIRVCDYKNICRKFYGPLVNTSEIVDFDEKVVIRNLKQKLLQENFDHIFSFAMIVLNCANPQQTQNLKMLFSDELDYKIQEVLTREDSQRLNENILKSFRIYQKHLIVTESFLQTLSSVINHHVNTKEYKDRRVARQANIQSIDKIKNYIEDMQNLMQISEFLIKNLNDSESKNNETNNFLIMLEGWMEIGCSLINMSTKKELNVEMQSAAFSIKKINIRGSSLIPIPFASDTWELQGYLKLHFYDMESHNCLGLVAFRELFGRSNIFGASVYDPVHGKIQETNNTLTNLSLFLPIKDNTEHQQCFMSINGWITSCPYLNLESNKYFIECRCFGLGFFYLSDAQNNATNDLNTTINIDYNDINIRRRDIGQKISYVIIFSSLVGFIILFYIIRKLTIYPQPNMPLDHLHDGYMYEGVDLLD